MCYNRINKSVVEEAQSRMNVLRQYQVFSGAEKDNQGWIVKDAGGYTEKHNLTECATTGSISPL